MHRLVILNEKKEINTIINLERVDYFIRIRENITTVVFGNGKEIEIGVDSSQIANILDDEYPCHRNRLSVGENK